MRLFHVTTAVAARLILRDGFRDGACYYEWNSLLAYS